MEKNIYITKTAITQKELLKTNAHIGSSHKTWNPNSSKYLIGTRNNNQIINLTFTVMLMKRAFSFITQIHKLFGFAAFVNQEPFVRSKIKFKRKQIYYFAEKWQPGLLTNFKEIIRRFQDENIPKHHFASIKRLPNTVFLAQTKPNYWIINEARSVQIPIIAIIETEFSPNTVNYPIPCNSNSASLLDLVIKLYETSVYKGKMERLRNVFKTHS